jgi:hypothetical protein
MMAPLSSSEHGDSFLITEKIGGFCQEKDMEDFPLWFKLIIWGTVAATLLYAGWGMIRSILPA